MLFISLWKKESKSGHVFHGKRRRLDIEDIAPTPNADAADESITSRTDHYQYFAFLCGIASLQFADQNVLECICRPNVCASFCMHYVFANTCNYMNVGLASCFDVQ